jgi:hypothetical protein
MPLLICMQAGKVTSMVAGRPQQQSHCFCFSAASHLFLLLLLPLLLLQGARPAQQGCCQAGQPQRGKEESSKGMRGAAMADQIAASRQLSRLSQLPPASHAPARHGCQLQ